LIDLQERRIKAFEGKESKEAKAERTNAQRRIKLWLQRLKCARKRSSTPVVTAASGNCSVTGATVHLTGAGSCTVTGSQAGNANYGPAPDVPQSFSIAKANQTITFGALANKTFGDPDFDVAASASSGLPVSLSATGNCTIAGTTVHLTSAGSCTIIASQSGNANYNRALNVSRTFQIAKKRGRGGQGALN